MCSAAADIVERFAKSFFAGRFGKSLYGVLFLFLLFLGLVTSCQSVDPVVKIGLVAPFEGRQREVGYDVLYSARLAVREINEAGGIGGKRVALVALDDGGRDEFAQATAQSLAIDPGVVAVVGHWQSGTTAAAQPVYDQHDLLLLPGGQPPFGPMDPAFLPPEFTAAYADVTPFDEMPGPYAGAAYEAFQNLFTAFRLASEERGDINRETVKQAYQSLN